MPILLVCLCWWQAKELVAKINVLTIRMSHLNMTDADRATLRNLINIRLGVRALEMTKLCLNTN